MKSRVIILSCALVAVTGIQTEEDEGNEQQGGLSKAEITDDSFPQRSFPVVHSIYSILDKQFGGIPLTIQGAIVQNQHLYGTGRKQFSPLDVQRIKCGNLPCPRTWFVCQSAPCQYPGEFDEIINRCRSSLQNAEDLFRSIAELLLKVSDKMVKDGAFIKTADTNTVIESSKGILTEVAENIASLEQFLSNEVIGQVAQDVLIDIEALHSVLNILVKRLIEEEQGEEAKIPAAVYDRCFRPRDWTPQCRGRWPCTKIILFPTRYAYSQQRPSCSCQFSGFGSRVIQPIQGFSYQLTNPELTYQQLPQILQTLQMPLPSQLQQPLTSSPLHANVQSSHLLVVAQPQPQQLPQPLEPRLFSQSQVYALPQYHTVRYQPSVSLTSDQVFPHSSNIISPKFSQNQISSGSNIQQELTQTNPQQISMVPQYQGNRHFQTFYPETITPFENLLTQPVARRESSANVQQSVIYKQPHYPTVQQYAPALYTSDDVGGDFTDGNHSAQQTLSQFTQKPKFVQAQQFTSPSQYQNAHQFRSVFNAPVPPLTEYVQPSIRQQDNSTNPQQAEGQQLGFAQTPQQYFTQPPYIQYKPAKYATDTRSLDPSSNSPNGQSVGPLHQVYHQPQYQTVKQIQTNSPAPENGFSLPIRNVENSTESTTQKNR